MQQAEELMRPPGESEKQSLRVSLLTSLLIVAASLYIVWPSFAKMVELSKKPEPIYTPASGGTSRPLRVRQREERQIRELVLPMLYPDLEKLDQIADEDYQVNDSSDWSDLEIDGRVDGTDLGYGEGMGGPVYDGTGLGGDVPEPVLIYRVEPDYPEAARRARLDGMVLIEAIVDTQGHVVDPKVLQSAPRRYGFAEKALEAVVQWRFRPSIYRGRPVNVRIRFFVEFDLLY